MADRAVSVAVNYALSLAIAVVVLSVLLVATGDILHDRQQEVIRSELRVVGQRTVTSLMMADRLAAVGGTRVSVEAPAPASVAGRPYRVRVNASSSGSTLTLVTVDPPVSIELGFANQTAVENVTVAGGDLRIERSGAGPLEVREA